VIEVCFARNGAYLKYVPRRSGLVWGTSTLRTVITRTPIFSPSMLRRCSLLSLFSVFLFVAACSTPRRIESPLRAPSPVQKSAPSPNKTGIKPKLAVGDFAVLIESEPSGGIVVVNGVPMGRTPQSVVVSGNARGFVRDAISIKVRFVAADTDHTSQTVEEQLTPLDKIPASVHFAPTGATRVAR